MAGGTGPDVAERLHDVLARLFGRPAPVRIRGWDGSLAGPDDAPILAVSSRRALRRMLWRPDELGLARAYVAGEVDPEQDLAQTLSWLLPYGREIGRRPDLGPTDRREILRTAVLLGAVGPHPKPPPEELTGEQRRGSVRDHSAHVGVEEVGNAFFAHVLGPALVYSAGYWADGVDDLEAAQRAKHDLVARRLELAPGARLLDVGCGWGSFLIHAAQQYGVEGVGTTVSTQQAGLATKRIAEAGLAGRIEVRVADWREIDAGPYDAISSIGVAEHVGVERYGDYAVTLAGLLRPGGRLLSQQTVRRGGSAQPERSFIDAYVFPDARLLGLTEVIGALERAGLETRSTESLREHYARTFRAWAANLDEHWDACVEEVSPGRARVWRLYLAATALAFETATISMHQVLATRADADTGGHTLER